MKCGICQQRLGSLVELCSCGQDPHAGHELAGRYRLLGLIAQGGMGMIYRGLSLDQDQLLAIKISRWSEALQHLRQLEPEDARREEEARVGREFKLLQKASSQTPHIVQAFDGMRDDPRVGLYYPMEFLEGLPLAKLPTWGRPLPTDAVVELALQICDGISVAHGLGVVHRDLNPDNIFIVRTQEHPHFVKLIDFGIARDLYARRDIYNTGHDMAFGHLHYLAPEQVGYNPKTGDYETATAAKLDTRADIFTIGAILFHMLVGYPPFEDDTVEGLALRDWDQPENLTRAIEHGLLPGALNDIVASCLAPEPAQRPPDIFVLSDMLRSFKKSTERVPLAPFRQAPAKIDSGELWQAIDESLTPGEDGALDSFSAEFDNIFDEEDDSAGQSSPDGFVFPSGVVGLDAPEDLSQLQVSPPSGVFNAADDDDTLRFYRDPQESLFESNDTLPAATSSMVALLGAEPAPPPPPPRRPQPGRSSASTGSSIDALIEDSLSIEPTSNPSSARPLPSSSKPPLLLFVALGVAILLVGAGIFLLFT